MLISIMFARLFCLRLFPSFKENQERNERKRGESRQKKRLSSVTSHFLASSFVFVFVNVLTSYWFIIFYVLQVMKITIIVNLKCHKKQTSKFDSVADCSLFSLL